MRGDKVIVRAYGDEFLIRRVWEETEDIVFICSEENYITLELGHDGLWPVGIHRSNVFQFNSDIQIEQGNPAFSERLIPYE